MRLSAKILAAMLMVSALAAFQFDSLAQSRGNSRSSSTARSSSSAKSSSSSTRSSSSSTRSSSSSVRSSSSDSKSASVRQSSTSKSSTSSSRTSTSASRKPSDSSKTKVTRPSGQSQTQAKPQSKPQTSSQNKPQVSSPNKPQTTPQTRPETTRKPDISPADRDKKPTVSRPSGNKPAPGNKPSSGSVSRPKPGAPKPDFKPGKHDKPDFKPGKHDKPIHVHRPGNRPAPPRIHPRERDFMHYSKPAYHWSVTPHYYGYRVRTLPVNVIRHIYGGITYYYYDNIWYRPYDGYYIVSRPPFGVSLAANLIADAAWTAVKLSYYNTVANTFSLINENNEYIAQQNAVIAQNNALIAAQNQQIAQTQTKAQAAYTLANELGLIQSYAAANSEYFYQDGVFYSMGTDGQYYVIVPPAGALVEELPEDFDTIILKGKEYFKVDDTVYQMTITDGKPYFEVLGQLY